MSSFIASPQAPARRMPWRLQPFQPAHASTIAAWAPDDAALRRLAPGTFAPLTPQKVLDWIKPHTRAFVMIRPDDKTPVGYGELNPMRDDPRHWWLGHIVVAPEHRGSGLGHALVARLRDLAILRHGASRLSLIVYRDNLPARRCYERAGFEFVGEEVHHFSPHPAPQTLVRYEWRR